MITPLTRETTCTFLFKTTECSKIDNYSFGPVSVDRSLVSEERAIRIVLSRRTTPDRARVQRAVEGKDFNTCKQK